MADKFTEFVVGLGGDATKLAAFRKDPQVAMATAGLSKAEQQVLLSGDPGQIRNALDDTVLAGDNVVVVAVVVVVV